MTLEPGSFAVMISDGVADPSRDEWLQDLLAGWGGDDPQTLANLILSESIRRERLQDDCAVQVLYRLPGVGAAGMRKIFKKPLLVGIDFPPLRENGNRSTEEDSTHGKRHFPAGRGGRRAGASFF